MKSILTLLGLGAVGAGIYFMLRPQSTTLTPAANAGVQNIAQKTAASGAAVPGPITAQIPLNINDKLLSKTPETTTNLPTTSLWSAIAPYSPDGIVTTLPV